MGKPHQDWKGSRQGQLVNREFLKQSSGQYATCIDETTKGGRSLFVSCLSMLPDLGMLSSRAWPSGAFFARCNVARSLLLSIDALPLPAAGANFCGQDFRQVKNSRISAAAALSRGLLSRHIPRPSTSARATASELDEIEILATPEEVQLESAGPFDQLGCDDRVTVSLHQMPHKSYLT